MSGVVVMVAIRPTPDASPSNPSIRLTAFVQTTSQRIQSGIFTHGAARIEW